MNLLAGRCRRYLVFVLVGLLAILSRLVLLSAGPIMSAWADSLCKLPHKCKAPLLEGLTNDQYLLLFLSVIMVGSILTFCYRTLISSIAISFIGSKHDSVMQTVSCTSKQNFDRFSTGEVLQLLAGDYAVVQRFFGGSIGELVTGILDLGIILAFFAFFDRLSLVPCLVLGLIAWKTYLNEKRKIFDHKRRLIRKRSSLLQCFNDDVVGKLDISQYDATNFFDVRFERSQKVWHQARVTSQIIQTKYAWKMGALNGLAIMFVGIAGVVSVHMGWSSGGTLISSITFALLGVNTLANLLESVPRIEEARSSLSHILQFEKNISMPSPLPFALKIIESRSIAVKLDDACVIIPGRSKPLIEAASISVKHGQVLGIIGPSGCGKSTLLCALLGIHSLSRGRISVDPYFHATSAADFRKRFVVIPQSPTLTPGRLRDNLAHSEHQATDEDILDALNKVGLLKLFGEPVDALVLDKIVNNNDAQISMGERQLLMAARAVLQQDAIVVMDEPTSMMDRHQEEKFLHLVDYALKGRTQIRVAHTLSVIKNCDQLVYMEDGRIIMIGTVEEILSKYSIRS